MKVHAKEKPKVIEQKIEKSSSITSEIPLQESLPQILLQSNTPDHSSNEPCYQQHAPHTVGEGLTPEIRYEESKLDG